MESLLNLNRETHKSHHKKILEVFAGVTKWIESVGGTNEKDALQFLDIYFNHLNENTKRSMLEHLLDITSTRMQDLSKQKDLITLIDELYKLKYQIKYL